ncbi:hypothetical protein URH17368_1963 [Alicyclobacillus hesperidum URH17-3-68]|uniref:Uncharacterized protein n=1 Tax=Alicyclobacillus hesperidum TaxID=89784 RepID=A0AA37X4U0_9BACL|nr:HepT-like ribonuclease domain-containing protein [Alicyclobacillus hesperidum]EJY55223.1 hypothetical protein URH17368_1963 [Alicyclobacillus hesperidum URH17-3-68]GLV13598.1 hypothetical protein Heshes_12820 [Alicyclobacillus hesperidum]
MFLTDAHKEQIETWLAGLSERVTWLQTLSQQSDAWEHDLTWRLAAERALHTSVEYVTDISSLIIDALVMRDPGGYADIVKVLVEEQVVDAQWFDSFTGIFDLRTKLLRDHAQVTPTEIRQAVVRYANQFSPFIDAIRAYIK